MYVGIGDEPVGRPSTNGFSGVGRKSLILRLDAWGPVVRVSDQFGACPLLDG